MYKKTINNGTLFYDTNQYCHKHIVYSDYCFCSFFPYINDRR